MTRHRMFARLVPPARLLALLLCASLALAAGCSTTLGVSRFDPQPSPITEKKKELVTNGIYYALPAAEYEVILERKLAGCDCVNEQTGEPCKYSERCVWKIAIGIDAEIKVKYKPDLYATYFVDYRWLDRAMKQTELRIDLYENGTLKSLNAGITDYTAEVLEKTIGTALNLVASAVGLPAVPSEAKGVDKVACNAKEDILKEKVRVALKNTESLKNEIKAMKDSIPTMEQAIKVMASRQDVDITKLVQAQNELENKQRELASFEKKLEGYQAKLIHKTSFTFTPRLDFTKQKGNECFTIEEAKLKAFEDGQGAIDKWFDAKKLKAAEATAEVQKLVGVTMKFYGIPQGQKKPVSQQKPCCFGAPSDEPEPGLVYRQPLLTKWALCRGVGNGPCGAEIDAENFKTGEDLVPQLGIVMSLPLESDTFEDQTLEAAFRPDGSLEYAQFSDKAGAVKAANAFATSAGSLAQFLNARRQAEKTKAEDETARINAETEKLKADLELQKAKQALKEYYESQSGE